MLNDADSLFTVGARPVGECNCDRAAAENSKVTGDTCACGQRASGKHSVLA